MSQVTQSTLTIRNQLRAHRIVAVSALLALLAATAVTLVLVIENGSSTVSGSVAKPQAAFRSDGGPDEAAVAASVAPRPSAGPDEAAVAASVAQRPSAGPDEAAVAAHIGGPRMYPSGPDGNSAGASISGR